MNDAEITLIRYRMDRSKEALSAARLMYEKGHYNDAVNRLYYSLLLCGNSPFGNRRRSSGQTYHGAGFSEQEMDKDRQAFKRNGTVIQHAFR
jgi:hypothetical protein